MTRCLPGLFLAIALLPAAATDIARGEQIVHERCFVCHGFDGESSTPKFPRLAGQHAAYVERQLADYKSGRRKSEAMAPMVKDLVPADFAALGRYFESRPPVSHPVADPVLAASGKALYAQGNPAGGVPPCAACHGVDGAGTPALPRLAGQHAQYIEGQLKAFGRRERTNDNEVMHAVASRLSEQEMRAVAAYVSGLR
jgi:cytochrome c553